MRYFMSAIEVLAVGLAALGSAGSVWAETAPVCGLKTGKPATGAPIEIGAVAGKTGPADFSAAAKSAKAYFDCVNANDGINRDRRRRRLARVLFSRTSPHSVRDRA